MGKSRSRDSSMHQEDYTTLTDRISDLGITAPSSKRDKHEIPVAELSPCYSYSSIKYRTFVKCDVNELVFAIGGSELINSLALNRKHANAKLDPVSPRPPDQFAAIEASMGVHAFNLHLLASLAKSHLSTSQEPSLQLLDRQWQHEVGSLQSETECDETGNDPDCSHHCPYVLNLLLGCQYSPISGLDLRTTNEHVLLPTIAIDANLAQWQTQYECCCEQYYPIGTLPKQIDHLIDLGIRIYNEQPYRAFLPILAIEPTKLYLFVLDRECMRYTEVEDWRGMNLDLAAALVQTLQTAPIASFGHLPFITLVDSAPHHLDLNLLPSSAPLNITRHIKVSTQLSKNPERIFCRATWAASNESRSIVVKMQWVDEDTDCDEPAMLARLQGDANSHFPQLLYHFDFPRLRCQTKRLPSRGHVRRLRLMITSTPQALYHLDQLKTEAIFWRAIRGTFQATYDAYLRGVLHRDISLGNAMATEDGHAILIDWDNATLIDPSSPQHAAQSTGARGTLVTAGPEVRHGIYKEPGIPRPRGPFRHFPRYDLQAVFNLMLYAICQRIVNGTTATLPESDPQQVYDAFEWHTDPINWVHMSRTWYIRLNLTTTIAYANTSDFTFPTIDLIEALADPKSRDIVRNTAQVLDDANKFAMDDDRRDKMTFTERHQEFDQLTSISMYMQLFSRTMDALKY